MVESQFWEVITMTRYSYLLLAALLAFVFASSALGQEIGRVNDVPPIRIVQPIRSVELPPLPRSIKIDPPRVIAPPPPRLERIEEPEGHMPCHWESVPFWESYADSRGDIQWRRTYRMVKDCD